jgi:hypothetical protein
MHVRLRPTALSIGGSSKKARRNRYQYKLVIPSKGVYRADRHDSKPYWMWQDSSGCWLAGEELSAPVTSTTPDVFEDKFIDVRWMSRERITCPGVHAWCVWSDTDEDWSQEPYEFSTEVDDYGWERAALTPGEVLRDGWFDPAMMSDEDFLQLEDNDDEEDNCCICLEMLRNTSVYDQLGEPVQTACGHRFHAVCYARTMESTHHDPWCPMCRSYSFGTLRLQ